LNVKYPKEFEIYLCALELQDADGKSLQYFIFPIMPSTMDEEVGKLTNVKKSALGVTVLSTSSFVPTDINLVGSFGRNFKVLLGSSYKDLVGGYDNLTPKSLLKKVTDDVFDTRVKTGYGCIKILEDLIYQVDNTEGGVKRLVLYNLASGNNYIVEPLRFRISQSEGSPMIWNYSLQLKSVMKLETFMTDKELQEERLKLNAVGILQKTVNTVVNNLTKVLADSEPKTRTQVFRV